MSSHRRLCFVLGDQLSFDLASLQGLNKANDTVLLVEVMEEARDTQTLSIRTPNFPIIFRHQELISLLSG
ncbi:hypothetical protein C0058_13095 [Pseudomonas sp. NC02]|jgi:deoxyribodipyrimidine photolyase-like uncharacterized protein|nr:hypothetical protein C0058_13095 [Pseudomonas sp. NC02]